MVNLGEIELARDVVWIGALPGQLCRGAEQVRERDGALLIDPHVEPPARLNPGLHQIAPVHDGVVYEMRDYPTLAAAEAAFEAMQ